MDISSGGGGGLAEKLEHSLIIDILGILVYGYFGYVAYNNLGYNKSEIFGVSTDPTAVAVQLAIFMIFINVVEMLHDKVSGR